MMPEDEKFYCTVRIAALLGGVSVQRIRTLIRNKTLKARVDERGAYIVDPKSFEAWVTSARKAGRPRAADAP